VDKHYHANTNDLPYTSFKILQQPKPLNLQVSIAASPAPRARLHNLRIPIIKQSAPHIINDFGETSLSIRKDVFQVESFALNMEGLEGLVNYLLVASHQSNSMIGSRGTKECQGPSAMVADTFAFHTLKFTALLKPSGTCGMNLLQHHVSELARWVATWPNIFLLFGIWN
jgi:hypothetical protein